MSEYYQNQPLIRDTLGHIYDLDRHGREIMGTQDAEPYEAPVYYLDDDLAEYRINYVSRAKQSDWPRRVAHYNRAASLLGGSPTLGALSFVDRMPIDGGKQLVYLSHSLGGISTSGFLLGKTGLPVTHHYASLTHFEQLQADDPRITRPFITDRERFQRIESFVPIDEDYEQALGRLLALRPEQLHQFERPAPTQKQREELYETSRAQLVDLFAEHNIDALNVESSPVLTFKMGSNESFMNVALQVKSESSAIAPGQNQQVVNIGFIHEGNILLGVAPLTEATGLGKSIGLIGRGVMVDTYDELSYLARVINTLANHADHALIDTFGDDRQAFALEYFYRSVIPEPTDAAHNLVDFVAKRVV